MNQTPDHTPDGLNLPSGDRADSSSFGEMSETPESPSRRELIERYAKYAVVGAPLLLFASKAHAIHSKP